MAKQKLAAQKMGSSNAVKKAASKGSDGTWVKSIPENGITVRFVDGPSEWVGYTRYYDGDNYIPMVEGEQVPDGARVQFRFVANAYDCDNKRLVPLDIAKTLAQTLTTLEDKYGSLTNRDFTILRNGSGLDTSYTVAPEAPSKRTVKDKPLDLEELLLKIRAANLSGDDDELIDDDVDEDEDDIDDDEEVDDDDDEDEDDEDSDDDESDDDELYSHDELDEMSLADLKEIATDEFDIDPLPRGKAKVIAAILEAQEEAGDDDEEDDEEEGEWDEESLGELSKDELIAVAEEMDVEVPGRMTAKAKAALIDSILEVQAGDDGEEDEDDEEADDEEEADEDVLDEDALNEMPLAELKALAKEYGVTIKRGMKKEAIIEAIFDAAEEDED